MLKTEIKYFFFLTTNKFWLYFNFSNKCFSGFKQLFPLFLAKSIYLIIIFLSCIIYIIPLFLSQIKLEIYINDIIQYNRRKKRLHWVWTWRNIKWSVMANMSRSLGGFSIQVTLVRIALVFSIMLNCIHYSLFFKPNQI